jgi:hypothetical protein
VFDTETSEWSVAGSATAGGRAVGVAGGRVVFVGGGEDGREAEVFEGI